MPPKLRPVDIGGALHQQRLGAPARSATSTRRSELDELRRADDEHQRRAAAPSLDRLLAVGGGVADVLLVRPAIAGKRSFSAATISAVSSTDSVVWVTKPRPAGIGAARSSSTSATGLDQRHRAVGQLAHRADHFGMAGMADQQRSCRPALVVALGLACAPWTPAGRSRRGRTGCAPSASPARIWARHARRTPPGASVSGISRAPRRTPRPWPSAPRRHSGCGRSRGAHRPAAPYFFKARSTIWIARSTPAQKPRGWQSRIVRAAGGGVGWRPWAAEMAWRAGPCQGRPPIEAGGRQSGRWPSPRPAPPRARTRSARIAGAG